MFAILFEGLLIEIQEEIHHFAVLGGGRLRGTKIVNKHFVNKLAFPNSSTVLNEKCNQKNAPVNLLKVVARGAKPGSGAP